MSETNSETVVIVGPAYPYRGGLSTFNHRLAEEFNTKGTKSIIYNFTLQYPSVFFPGKTQFSDDLPPENIEIKRKISSVNPFNWIKIGKELKRLKPKILILRYWMPFMAPCMGTIARIVRKNKYTKVLLLADNIIPHEKFPLQNLLSKYIVNSVSGAVVMSQSVLNDIEKVSKKVKVIFKNHPAYDRYGDIVSREEALSKLDLNPDFRYLLFFGFIREYKGLDLLLKALTDQRIKDLPIKLIIAGEFYETEEKYIKIISDNKLSDKIILKSEFIANNQIPYYFCASDVVVQPYKTATQSGVTQISYFYNKPMIVTNVGGLPELVPDNIVGFVVEPNEKEIANAIYIFYNKNKEPEFVENVKKEAKRFSWSEFVDSFIELSK